MASFFNFDMDPEWVNAQIDVLEHKYAKWAYKEGIEAERRIRGYFLEAMASYNFPKGKVNPKFHPAAEVLEKYVGWLTKAGYKLGLKSGKIYAISPRNTVATRIPRSASGKAECVGFMNVIMSRRNQTVMVDD